MALEGGTSARTQSAGWSAGRLSPISGRYSPRRVLFPVVIRTIRTTFRPSGIAPLSIGIQSVGYPRPVGALPIHSILRPVGIPPLSVSF